MQDAWPVVEQARPLRYQLLHRTASAIYEAKRYRTDLAGMLVHNSQQNNPDIWISITSSGLWGGGIKSRCAVRAAR